MFSVTIRERGGQVYTFHFDKPEILIGRVKGNDVILPKQNISKRHAMVRVADEGFVVEDLGSTNGTYVNGHRIATAVELGTEDKLYLGDFVMQFFDLASADLASGLPPEIDGDTDGQAESGVAADEFPEIEADDERADLELLDDLEPLAEEPSSEQTEALFGGEAAAQIAAARHAAEAQSGVAAADPDAALEEIDERMTGPVDGLGQMLDDPAFDLAPDLSHDPVSDFGTDFGSDLSHEPAPDVAAAPPALDVPGVSDALDIPFLADEGAAPASAAEPGPVSATRRGPAGATQVEASPVDEAHHQALAYLYGRAQAEIGAAIPADAAELSDQEWAAMEEQVIRFVDSVDEAGALTGNVEIDALKRDLIYELTGLGPLEPMLDDASIETIEVSGYASVFVFRGGVRERAAQRFSGQQAFEAAVGRLVRASGAAQDNRVWHCEGTLADGTSLRVVWPPLCPAGPVLLLRKPRLRAHDLDALVNRGTVSIAAAECLRELVRSRRPIVFAGPRGAGRRTVMNAVALQIDHVDRVVVTEAGVRMRLPHPHAIRLDASVQRAGEPQLQTATRLMPDWLLLGECQSRDLAELVDASLDGLPPWMGFVYAESVGDLFERLVHGYAVHHPGLDRELATERVGMALDVVAQFSRDENGQAVLAEVCEVLRTAAGLDTRSLLDGDL